jgi:hypothetical protein
VLAAGALGVAVVALPAAAQQMKTVGGVVVNIGIVSATPHASGFMANNASRLFLRYGIFIRKRSGELGMMLKGMMDGMRRVTGKLEFHEQRASPTCTSNRKPGN